MGSINIQPPNGLSRNLTEVFVFLRNNAQQNHIQVEFETNGKWFFSFKHFYNDFFI